MQYFNIQVASQLSGVTSATIRAWEKRYNAVTPERAKNKHRLYSGKDIEKLTLLSRLTEIGQSIGKIAHLDIEKLKEFYATLLQKPYEEVQYPSVFENIEFSNYLQNIQIALQAKKFHIIGHELEKALLRSSPKEVCLHFIIPFIKEVRDQVENQVLLKSHEEMINNLLHFFLGKIIWNYVDRPDAPEKVIIFYQRKNDLLPLMIGVFLMDAQKTPFFFTTDDGLEDLLELVEEIQPSSIYLTSDLIQETRVKGLNIKKIVIPSEFESFLIFLKEEEGALRQNKPHQ